MYAKTLVRYRDGEQWALLEDVKEQREIVNARFTRQNEFPNGYVEKLPTDGPNTLADLKLEPESAEDEGATLNNEHGRRPISAVQQAAEWERGKKRVDAGHPRRVWLPTCHSQWPSAGVVTSLPIPLCRQCGRSPIHDE